jgi:hypothetical protein
MHYASLLVPIINTYVNHIWGELLAVTGRRELGRRDDGIGLFIGFFFRVRGVWKENSVGVTFVLGGVMWWVSFIKNLQTKNIILESKM